MPISSISAAEAQPNPVALARLRIFPDKSSRFATDNFLESFSPSIHSNLGYGKASGKITAPTTSGPASGPRPTSSIPKIIRPQPEFLQLVSQYQLVSLQSLEFLQLFLLSPPVLPQLELQLVLPLPPPSHRLLQFYQNLYLQV